MAKRPAKSETLTIRLDPKTRFMLEFVSRLRGQTITTVVERAISAAADEATLERAGETVNWRAYWNVNDGVRALRMARANALHPTYEEERRLRFAEQFWPFFYNDGNLGVFDLPFLEVLWPDIDGLIELHENSKTKNYNAAVEEMSRRLTEAGLKPPLWPPIQKDDEIPF